MLKLDRRYTKFYWDEETCGFITGFYVSYTNFKVENYATIESN